MNKREKIRKFISDVVTFLPRYYRKLSISTQLLVTFVLIFVSFFVLQTFLNNTFFKSYYAERAREKIDANIIEYVLEMNAEEEADYYDEMYKFTTENNAYSVIVNSGEYRILKSSHTQSTVTVVDSETNESYTYIVPNNDYDYTIGESITLKIYKYTDELYTPAIIITSTGEEYNNENSCDEEVCMDIEGTVSSIDRPNNLNYFFEDNNLIQLEVENIRSGEDLGARVYDSDNVEGYSYRSQEGPVDTLVFVHKLKTWNWIITVVPIIDSTEVVNIISAYNYYAYVTAIVIIIIWSFRVSSTLSQPIQNIEGVAREIAQLNFNVEAHEYTNKENESLSNSINLISRNLKETLEDVNTKNNELTELYDEQSKQVSLKKQLVSSISHELKTPLMIMQVTIQGILDGIIDADESDKELNNVLEEINKSSIMIQDMLQIYRLDDANTKLELSDFDLSKTVQTFIDDFEYAIKKYNFDVDINIQDDVIIEADLKLIKRVISNYITNAIKYTPDNGKIYVEVSETKEFAYFELTNYGISISESELEKIWLPFYRLEQEDTTRVRTKGSGIGLYLVSEILKAHQAEFGINNIKNGVKAYFKLNKKS